MRSPTGQFFCDFCGEPPRQNYDLTAGLGDVCICKRCAGLAARPQEAGAATTTPPAVSPGQFIEHIRAHLFEFSQADHICVDFDLTMLPDGTLNPLAPQRAHLYLALSRRGIWPRGTATNKQE